MILKMNAGSKTKWLVLVVATISLTITISNVNVASAHMSFKFIPGSGVISGSGCSSLPCAAPTLGNYTVSLVLGETFEPSFTDEYHDAELTLTHDLSSFGLGNAHKDQTKAAYKGSDFSSSGKVFLVETYFYPASALVDSSGNKSPTGGVKPSATTNTDSNSVGFSCNANGQGVYTGSVSAGVLSGNTFNCKANAGGSYGYTDVRTDMFMRPLGAAEGMSKDGQYRQSTRQFYTEQGLTLYHFYGAINYFNDTSVGLTKINLWTDGKNIKTLSMAAASGSGNRTYTVSGGFGLGNKTSLYWPDADGGATENNYPTNIRRAIGQIRDNSWDIWNVLEQISNGLNSITEFLPKVSDYSPRNYTNPGTTNNGQYTFP